MAGIYGTDDIDRYWETRLDEYLDETYEEEEKEETECDATESDLY